MLKSLSIVIPAYNEEKRLPTSLSTLFEWISGSKLDFVEIILIDDGSTDGTAALVEQMAASTRVVRLLRNGANRGKGYSVKNGILSVRGEWALVTDADLSSPVEEVSKLYDAAVQAKAAIAIGSRALNRALVGKRQPFAREFAGKVFNAVMRSVTGLPFQDTQCGFKLFHSVS